MSRARRAHVDVVYEHVNITEDIAGYSTSFSYTDSASGESDAIEITVQDREKKWMGGWAPKKGDHIGASVRFEDWRRDGDGWELYCGQFQIDDVSVSGPPAICKIGAVSIPRAEAFNDEQRTKSWEDVTVQELAAEIADRAGIALYYEADVIPVKAVEQDKQTDCKFLYSLCQKYGLAVKVFADKIIIFDEAVYEAQAPAAELRFEDFSKYQYNSTIAGTYTGVKLSYSHPGTGEDHIVTVGGGSRILEVNEEADSAEDAQRKAVAALNNANKKETTFSGEIMARPEIMAGRCVAIAGFGVPDGVYYIDKAVTKIGSSGATRQSIEMHKTGYRMDDANVHLDAQAENTEGTGGTYTVVKGDTLWTIARECLGSPLRYAEIYGLNREIIEAEAQGRGKKDSSNGHWLFPGTTLQLPPAEGGKESGEQ